jgi:hypothetical protein
MTPDPTPIAPARALIEEQMAMLSRLARMGMDIAEAVRRDACDTPQPPQDTPHDAAPARDPGLVFARVARAVRMTIALQSRLAKDLAALDRADQDAERAAKTRRRIRLSRLVEQAAEAGVAARREAGGGYWADEDAVEDEIEQLSAEAYERLVDAEDGVLDGLSFEAVVAGVVADLGLSPDWTARLRAAAAAPLDPSAPRPPGAGHDPPASPIPSGLPWTGPALQPRAPP